MERDGNGTVSVAAILRTEELASEFFHETEYRLDMDKVNALPNVLEPDVPGRALTPEAIAARLAQDAVSDKDDIDANHWLDGATTALSLIVKLREG